jgi:hypothetical protein
MTGFLVHMYHTLRKSVKNTKHGERRGKENEAGSLTRASPVLHGVDLGRHIHLLVVLFEGGKGRTSKANLGHISKPGSNIC